jgi:hypothetical protein
MKRSLAIKLILIILLSTAIFFILLSAIGGSIPLKYRALYSRLESNLNDYEKWLDSKKTVETGEITFAAELLPANANRGPDLLKPESIDGVSLYLDRLEALGVRGVTIAVGYPLYLQEFDHYQDYVDFYKRVVEEARKRGMKVDVKIGVIFSGAAFSKLNLNYSVLTFEEYKVNKKRMVVNIIRDLHPDYLTIGAEPDTEHDLLGLDELVKPEKYTELVNYVLEGIEKGNTKLGAGIGNWGNLDYVKRFCNETSLDFIVIHVYPVFGNLLYNIDKISEIARQYGKKIIMDEAWLYKVDKPVLNIAASAEVFRLDGFSFWAPLDQKFLAVIAKAAKVNGIEYVSPFWSTYFFAYVDYDWNTARLTYFELSEAVNREAIKNIVSGKFSSTGEFYRKLIESFKNS